MIRYLLLAAIAAATALAIAAVVPASGPALLGAGIASGTALASLAAFGLLGNGEKPMQRALAIFVGTFLVRMVLLALGLWSVTRSGQSALAYVVAFFLSYFVFAAIEGGYVHALGRNPGKTA